MQRSVAAGLILICWLLLKGCKKTLPEEPLTTAKVKTADKEVLAFLIVYLLPLFTRDLIFTGNLLTPAYVFATIAICAYYSNAFTFNPVLSMMGYHFYEVEIKDGMNYLLIARQTLRRNDNSLRVRELSDYIYFET